MSRNKEIVKALDSSDKARLASLLADEVEWVEWVDGVPATGAIQRGKQAFLSNYGDDVLQGKVTRMVEEGNVVVAEGDVRVTKKDGKKFTVHYCDIYELENGRVKRKSSYGALVKDAA